MKDLKFAKILMHYGQLEKIDKNLDRSLKYLFGFMKMLK